MIINLGKQLFPIVLATANGMISIQQVCKSTENISSTTPYVLVRLQYWTRSHYLRWQSDVLLSELLCFPKPPCCRRHTCTQRVCCLLLGNRLRFCLDLCIIHKSAVANYMCLFCEYFENSMKLASTCSLSPLSVII